MKKKGWNNISDSILTFLVENTAALLIKAAFSFLLFYSRFSHTFPFFMSLFYLPFYVYIVANQKMRNRSIKLTNA